MEISSLRTGGLTQEISYLFGEWSIWHSNFPTHEGSNKMRVYLFPERMIKVSHKKWQGPWLFEKCLKGQYILDKTNSLHNEIYSHKVVVQFNEYERRLISVLGIGVDDVPIIFKKKINHNIDMHLNIVGRDDLFLKTTLSSVNKLSDSIIHDEDGVIFYHLVRCIRSDEPSSNVPLSTFVVTQILGTGICYLIHFLFFHNFG